MRFFSKITSFGFTGITTILLFSSASGVSPSIDNTNTTTQTTIAITRPSQINSSQQLDGVKIEQEWINLIDLIIKIIVIVASTIWTCYKITQFREFKYWIQFDIEANLYEIKSNSELKDVILTTYSWKEGRREECENQKCTQVVEVLPKLTNKGKKRFRLYNSEIKIKTILDSDKLKCDKRDGHLMLQTVFINGNIIPEMPLPTRSWSIKLSSEKTSFYYIEPNVEQTLHFLAVIPKPLGVLQVIGDFSLEQKRKYSCKRQQKITKKGLLPHTAARTYQVDKNGCLVKEFGVEK